MNPLAYLRGGIGSCPPLAEKMFTFDMLNFEKLGYDPPLPPALSRSKYMYILDILPSQRISIYVTASENGNCIIIWPRSRPIDDVFHCGDGGTNNIK